MLSFALLQNDSAAWGHLVLVAPSVRRSTLLSSAHGDMQAAGTLFKDPN